MHEVHLSDGDLAPESHCLLLNLVIYIVVPFFLENLDILQMSLLLLEKLFLMNIF